jgi:nickel/cobalt transporter (NicO) family protein
MGFVRRGFGASLAIVLAMWCGPALAHPLGNFTINHLVKVRQSGGRLDIRYVLDMAEIPTFSVMRARSANASLDDTELRAWANDETSVVIDGLDVESGGRRIAIEPLGVPAVRTRPGAGGLPTLYFAADFSALPPSSDVTIADQTYPDRIGWKDVVVYPATEPTAELTHYPTALLASPRDVTTASLERTRNGAWIATHAAVASSQSPAQAGPSQLRSNVLADMLARGPSSAVVIALTLLAAIGLGALHALEPGHGKTLLAVSLVGARATPKQAVTLAAALTVAHTAGVVALGLALLCAARWIVPEDIYPWLTAISGLVVVCLGGAALARYMRARHHAADGHDHQGGHGHDGDHSHGDAAAHGHSHAIPGNAPLSFGNVVLIAMSGNIAPCPAALVVMLAALALHQVAYGIVIIIAFGMGLAAVLTGLGLALVRGTAWIARSRTAERFMAYGPVVSACVISVIGAIMLGQGIAGGIIRVQPWAVIALTLTAIGGYALQAAHGHTHRHEGSHA